MADQSYTLEEQNLLYEEGQLPGAKDAPSGLPPAEIARRASALRTGELLGLVREEWVGPRYCAVCGQWPALNAGRLCNSCDDIRHAHENPVPGGPEGQSPNTEAREPGTR